MTGLLRACSGLIVWAVVFALLYGIEGMGCSAGWDAGGLRTLLVIIWLAGVIALAGLCWRWRSARSADLLDRATLGLAIVGLVATIVTGAPVAILSLCL